MAKKADLKYASDQYDAAILAASRFEDQGLYMRALDSAVSAWPFIVDMMAYRIRFEEKTFTTIHAITLALRYAPLVFRPRVLDKLSELLKDERSIDKRAGADLADDLAKARDRLWLNHKLFSLIEANPGIRQDTLRSRMGGEQDYWRNTIEVWERMELVCRTPEANSYRVSLTTRLGQVFNAKCPRCGGIASAPKAMFMEQVRHLQHLWIVRTPRLKGDIAHGLADLLCHWVARRRWVRDWRALSAA